MPSKALSTPRPANPPLTSLPPPTTMNTPDTQPAPHAIQPILTQTGINPVAGLAAIAFPGAGHLVAGQPKRAICIAIGVLGLFFGGLFIGGITIIDRQDNGWWFIAHGCVGPVAFGVDYVHQHKFRAPDPDKPGRFKTPPPGPNQTYIKSVGKSLDIGTLFSAVAGMLNLIAIIDAAFPTRRVKP